MNKKFGLLSVVVILIIIAVLILTTTNFISKTSFFVEGYGEEKIENALDYFASGSKFVAMNRIDSEELSYVSDRIFDDPRLFWVDFKHNAISIGDVSLIVLREKYGGIEDKWNEIETKSDVVLDSIIKDDMDDYEKTLAIYDWICENLEYKEMPNDADQDLYGALILKKARCAGYAKLFSYMLEKAGIESSVVSGTAIDKSGESIPHAWNVATIEGHPYYFDITWDDNDDGHSYEWFGITTSEFKTSHFPSDGYEWENANEVDANYYVRNNMYMPRYTAGELAKQIVSQGNTVYIKCADDRVMDKLILAFGDRSELQKIMKMSGMQYINEIAYFENPKTNCIKVVFS